MSLTAKKVFDTTFVYKSIILWQKRVQKPSLKFKVSNNCFHEKRVESIAISFSSKKTSRVDQYV